MFETVPREEQAKASTIFSLGVIGGPAIGPALGGYLTDNFNWRWIFFINIPLGILAVWMATTFLPEDDPHARKSGSVDWQGILFLALGLGAFQTVLEQGQQDDWFSSNFIRDMAILSVVGLVLFVWQELRTAHPAVDLRVLRYRSLTAGSLISLAVGMGLYGTIFVVPVFAQTVLNFTATKTGLMLVPGALASAVAMFALAPMMKILSPRKLIAAGCLITIGVMFAFAGLNPDTGSDQFFLAADLARLRHGGDVPAAVDRDARRAAEEGRGLRLRLLQPHAAAGRQHRHRGDHDAGGQTAGRPPLGARLRRLRPEPGLQRPPQRQHLLPQHDQWRPERGAQPGTGDDRPRHQRPGRAAQATATCSSSSRPSFPSPCR